MVLKKGKGLDLGAEPPRIKLCRIPCSPPPPPPLYAYASPSQDIFRYGVQFSGGCYPHARDIDVFDEDEAV